MKNAENTTAALSESQDSLAEERPLTAEEQHYYDEFVAFRPNRDHDGPVWGSVALAELDEPYLLWYENDLDEETESLKHKWLMNDSTLTEADRRALARTYATFRARGSNVIELRKISKHSKETPRDARRAA
ncbi:MAG: hypothetical protein A2542_00430 [Parcubacteria group bacterium RIFOXYD2_FULL_52_8]|nr:MAG: hypothetical protein A2542_00430 [Parcubacteria group bacterium RIFOXYD2_FULL_52_8]